MKAQRGFTVLELLVVAAVLMILASMAIPMGGLSEKQRLDTVQLEIQDAIDFAKASAYKQGLPRGVKFGTSGNGWLAVINQVAVPIEDPLSHGDYVVRLTDPNQPKGVRITYALFGVRPVAAFNEKGLLQFPGQIHLECGGSQRWLALDTATTKLSEIPAAE